MAEPVALDPRTVSLWRLEALIRLGILGLPFSVGAGTAVGFALGTAVGFALSALLLLGFSALSVVWPALEYQHFRYALRETDLLVQRGVLFRTWTSVPYNRIQHVDTRQGPLERLLGLSRVLVYTASGLGADGSIPGLDEARAARLRDTLSRRGGDDGV